MNNDLFSYATRNKLRFPLAGLGFSSTKKDAFVIRVRSGKTQRTYNVKIG
jgi:hypothetical protein